MCTEARAAYFSLMMFLTGIHFPTVTGPTNTITNMRNMYIFKYILKWQSVFPALWVPTSFLDRFYFFYVMFFSYMDVYTLCMYLVPMETKEGIVECPGTGVTDRCELPCWMLRTQTRSSQEDWTISSVLVPASLQNFTPLKISVFLLTTHWFIYEPNAAMA